MKKFSVLQLTCFMAILIAIGYTSCNVGVKKDFIFGLRVANNGLDAEEVYISIDGQQTSSNKIEYGKNVYIIFDNITGFKLVNDKASAGCSIRVTDKEGNEIYAFPDLFAGKYESVPPEQLSSVRVNVFTGTPLKEGETYTWLTRVWDKNSSGEIRTELNIEIVKPKDVPRTDGLKVNNNGITNYNAYLSVNDTPLKDNKVSEGDEVALNFIDIGGLQKIQGAYQIEFYITVSDIQDNLLMEYKDTLRYADVIYLTSKLHITDPLKTGEQYRWYTIFTDLATKGYVEGDIILEIIE